VEYTQRIRALADKLCTDGIDARIDKYEQDPDEGWIRWMRTQVKEADKVLPAFTETYQRRFEGDEEVGKGLGATFEGVIVTQNFYKSGGRNAKFRPVVFDAKDARFISDELRCFNHYQFDTPENYDALLRWLYEEPEVKQPPPGSKRIFETKATPELFPERRAPPPNGADENSIPRDPPVAVGSPPPKRLWWFVGAIAAVAIWFLSEEFLYRLGDMYKKGEVFTKDLDKARYLYWIAAKMGNAWGMENLGELYEYDAQYAKARDSYEEAAHKGIAWGMFLLAGLYKKGLGGAKDDAMAKHWYEKAAADAEVKEAAEEALRHM
jgi:SEFIR domain